jgi:hypothetical protein
LVTYWLAEVTAKHTDRDSQDITVKAGDVVYDE